MLRCAALRYTGHCTSLHCAALDTALHWTLRCTAASATAARLPHSASLPVIDRQRPRTAPHTNPHQHHPPIIITTNNNQPRQQRGAHWAAVLDRLAVANVRHAQVAAQLRPLLRAYVAHPIFIDSPQLEADVPSLLASRLLPEQEAAEAAARERLLGPVAAAAVGAPGAGGAEALLEAAEQQLEGLRLAAATLFGGSGSVGAVAVEEGPLGCRSAQRRAIDSLAAQIGRAVADQQAARARRAAAAAGVR